MRMTANTFGIHQCTVSNMIVQVCSAISEHLSPEYIRLPKTQDEMREKIAQFETKFGMVHAFSRIDGTHIPISRPHMDSQDYFNYKNFFSLNVQAVCDAKGYFMDIDCRWPGSVHNAKVLSNSALNIKLKHGTIPQLYSHLLPGHAQIPCYLIGDLAYPLTPNCMKEFQACKTNAQVIFNNMLQSARNPIECAFGRLKARWSILTRKMDLQLHTIPKVVHACFVLHSFCEQHTSSIDEEAVKSQIQRNRLEEETYKNLPDPIYSNTASEGESIRKTLVEYMEINLPDRYSVGNQTELHEH